MASGQNDLFVIFDASSFGTLTLAYHVPRYLDSETEHARTSTSLSLHHFTIDVALQPGHTFPTKNTFRRTRVVPASTFGDSFRAGFHCGSAAPLLVFRGLKRHHYHSDRGSSWSSESAAHRELLLRFLTKNCEPRSRLDLFPVLCIVLYSRILKFKF